MSETSPTPFNPLPTESTPKLPTPKEPKLKNLPEEKPVAHPPMLPQRFLPPPALQVVTVYPTGDYGKDVDNIKWAVRDPYRQGSLWTTPAFPAVQPVHRWPLSLLVMLKATLEAPDANTKTYMAFNLGDGTEHERASIQVGYNVMIVGEGLDHDEQVFLDSTMTKTVMADRTVIYGGHQVFSSDLFAVQLSISNLFFAWPGWGAVQVHKSAGLEVSGCVVYNVLWGEARVNGAFGIEATAGGGGKSSDLTGTFSVHHNVLHRDVASITENHDDDVGIGIVLQNAEMDASIHDNQIFNFSLAGIGIDRGYGRISVSGNTVSYCGYCQEQVANPLSKYGSGIAIMKTDAAPSHPVLIGREQDDDEDRANTVDCGDPSGAGQVSGYGIVLANCTGVSVLRNKVTGSVSKEGIASVDLKTGNLVDPDPDNEIEENIISATNP